MQKIAELKEHADFFTKRGNALWCVEAMKPIIASKTKATPRQRQRAKRAFGSFDKHIHGIKEYLTLVEVLIAAATTKMTEE